MHAGSYQSAAEIVPQSRRTMFSAFTDEQLRDPHNYKPSYHDWAPPKRSAAAKSAMSTTHPANQLTNMPKIGQGSKASQSTNIFHPSIINPRSRSPSPGNTTGGRAEKRKQTGSYFPDVSARSFPHCSHVYVDNRPIPRQSSKCTVSKDFVPNEVFAQWRQEDQANSYNLSPVMKSKKGKL